MSPRDCGGRGHLCVERFALQRQALQLGFHLPNFLSAILQDEQLLQLDLHARMLGAPGDDRNVNRLASGALNAPKDDAGVDPAEAKRVAQHVIDRRLASVLRDNVEIAGRIGVFPVQRRRNPAAIDR